MKQYAVGFLIGLVVAVVVFFWQFLKRMASESRSKKEIEKYKEMLSQRMELESEGMTKLKKENDELKKMNENLRVTNSALIQKPGRAEVQRLQVYQKAVDRLTINSPGFGAAWQSALKESEDEFAEIYTGTQALWKKILPNKTNARLITEKEEVVDEQ